MASEKPPKRIGRLALAVSPREQERFEQRFLAEARIAARLSHPGIVGTFKPGVTRRLLVEVGRLSGDLSLEWQP